MADDKNNIANVPTATLENEYVAALLAEIERLRRWKTEATTVLAEWDAVWECAGKGTLGESKQRGVVAELGRLDAEIERLRAAGDALAEQITKPCRCVEAHDGAINETCAPCAACFDWQEARRG